MKHERVLVTGAQGFVGRFVVAEATRAGHTVLGLGRSQYDPVAFTYSFRLHDRRYGVPLPPEARVPSDADFQYRVCDLRSTSDVNRTIAWFKPDRIIHLAGALRDSEQISLIENNCHATRNLTQALVSSVPRALLLLGSSGAVYGDQSSLPISEVAQPKPVGNYAQSKLESERVAREITSGTGIKTVAARIFNLFGPGIQDRHLPGHLAHAIAELELTNAPGSIELGDLESTRDIVDVRDVAQWLIDVPEENLNPIHNLASGVERSMRSIVDTFASQARILFNVRVDTARNRVGSDRSVARSGLGAHIGRLRPFEGSVRDTLAHARWSIEYHQKPSSISAT